MLLFYIIGSLSSTAGGKASILRHYPAYKSKQLNVSELARVCDISRTTVYKYIGFWKHKNTTTGEAGGCPACQKTSKIPSFLV